MTQSSKQNLTLSPRSISEALLAWYAEHGRTLPWRKKPINPYHVWVSEIMLQQTTVTAVIPYYNSFLARWPTPHDLAQEPLDDILHAWQGLGYYRRARLLHACSQKIATDYHGQLPTTAEALLTLPGIGRYTAAAIASIAFDQPIAAVDGNVMRVMARMFLLEDLQPHLFQASLERAQALVPSENAGDFTQALMDLGATICTPRNPSCTLCPWATHCKAYHVGKVAFFPVRKQPITTPTRHGYVYALWHATGDLLLLEQRPPQGLLAGTWQLPTTEWSENPSHLTWLSPLQCIGHVKHVFTHFKLSLTVYEATLKVPMLFMPHQRWFRPEDLSSLAFSTLMRKVLVQAMTCRHSPTSIAQSGQSFADDAR